MINDLTEKQKSEAALFLFSILNMKKDCLIHMGISEPMGKCFMAVPPEFKAKQDLFECMMLAFTPDGENAFGITFEGEFLFFSKNAFISGFPSTG